MLRRFQRFEAPKSLNVASLKAQSAAVAEDAIGGRVSDVDSLGATVFQQNDAGDICSWESTSFFDAPKHFV